MIICSFWSPYLLIFVFRAILIHSSRTLCFYFESHSSYLSRSNFRQLDTEFTCAEFTDGSHFLVVTSRGRGPIWEQRAPARKQRRRGTGPSAFFTHRQEADMCGGGARPSAVSGNSPSGVTLHLQTGKEGLEIPSDVSFEW